MHLLQVQSARRLTAKGEVVINLGVAVTDWWPGPPRLETCQLSWRIGRDGRDAWWALPLAAEDVQEFWRLVDAAVDKLDRFKVLQDLVDEWRIHFEKGSPSWDVLQNLAQAYLSLGQLEAHREVQERIANYR